ncbi:MAG: globin domain-containing protein [Candidatus Kariarchaeaceae archaeon]|jgi:hemoglobin-like flavoprotein
MLSAAEISSIESSWKLIFPVREEFAKQFYESLFEYNLELKELFNTNIEFQGSKLMKFFDFILHNLDNVSNVGSDIRKLGSKHLELGIKKEDYTVFGSIFLRTIEDILGTSCTAEIKDAWASLYDILAELMFTNQ